MTLDTSRKNKESRLIRMQVVQSVEKDTFTEQVQNAIKAKHIDTVRVDDALEFHLNGVRFTYRVEAIENFELLTSTIKYDTDNDVEGVNAGKRLFEELDLLMALPSPVYTTFLIFASEVADEEQASALSEVYSRQLSRPKIGVGVVGGCLFSILDSKAEDDQFNKYYFVSLIKPSSDAVSHHFNENIENIKKIVIYSAQLSRLYRGSNNLFSAFKPGEVEINERTEAFLWSLIRPEPVRLETLES